MAVGNLGCALVSVAVVYMDYSLGQKSGCCRGGHCRGVAVSGRLTLVIFLSFSHTVEALLRGS